MKTQTTKVQARMSPNLKARAEEIFAELGITSTEAIRMLYQQVILRRGLPFAVEIPNEITLAAIAEAEDPERLETVDDIDVFLASL
ncbi:type II toxin-antitoxin system RelB/DinJ family antitoxin [Candidatus Synechococcus calcipolaris G9]|uniref:Type II toxin-antitoxin system RelB/DinJ family antitoxin n=1 Tax=Candidatus Synechococcus calcipolaris G9 TaxID=1497997 RepID=A0ABT6EYU1_9SYNE|nr:type II toxin-antitoxin system RelB/DinJ family antitoxin [Candidatus Synechococcus calcipolaris]MDG2990652.1 type II toxin-antitoxin system RelB/DinJ family antitoxin [Candidatus Synechococcus calcipolaris G9]